MKKLFLPLLIAIFYLSSFPEQAHAQRRGADYQTAAGLRLSGWYGVSAKHFIQGNNAIEGILHSHWDGLKITGLYEIHQQAFGEPGLKFYYGGGAHLGFVGNRYIGRWDYVNGYSGGTRALLGIDGIIGIEYTIQEDDIPINISLDWKPVIDIVPWFWFRGVEAGLTVRYIFQY